MPGFVGLWRDYLDHEVFQNERLWRLFSWCLMSANFRPSTFRGVSLEAGQFALGRVTAAKLLNIPEATLYRHLKILEKMGLISLKANSMFTVVTLCDRRPFEVPEIESDTANDTAIDTTTDTADEQPVIQQVSTEEQRTKNKETREEKTGPVGPSDPPKTEPKRKSTIVTADSIKYPAGLDTPEVRDAVARWLEHKRGLGQKYKSTESAQAIFRNGDWQICGPVGFIEAVDRSIGNNYMGVFPPKVQNGKANGTGNHRPINRDFIAPNPIASDDERIFAEVERTNRENAERLASETARGVPGS